MSNPATGNAPPNDIKWRTAQGEEMSLSQMTDSHLLYAMMRLQRNCMSRYSDTVSRNYASVQASRFHLTKICQLAGEYANRNLLPAEVDTEEQLWNWLLGKNDEYTANKARKDARNFTQHPPHLHVQPDRQITTVTQYQAPPNQASPMADVVVEVERRLIFRPL